MRWIFCFNGAEVFHHSNIFISLGKCCNALYNVFRFRIEFFLERRDESFALGSLIDGTEKITKGNCVER